MKGIAPPPVGTPERREYCRAIARRGGLVHGEERRQRAKFAKLVETMLRARVPASGRLGETLARAGLDVSKPVTAKAAVVGVLIAKAVGGDLKAAKMVLDLAGLTGSAAERAARTRVLDATADRGGLATADSAVAALAPPSPAEMDAEASRMGVYEQTELFPGDGE